MQNVIEFMLPKRSACARVFGKSGISLELYLFLFRSRPSSLDFRPMLSWPQNYVKIEFNLYDLVAAKTSFFDVCLSKPKFRKFQK